jgi:hypothetical protein
MSEVVTGALGTPTIALTLGVLASLVLFRFSRFSAHSVDPDDRSLSLIRLSVSLLGRLVAAALALAAYLYLAPDGLAWFGAGLGGGFFGMSIIEMYRRGRAARLRREHLVPVNKEG